MGNFKDLAVCTLCMYGLRKYQLTSSQLAKVLHYNNTQLQYLEEEDSVKIVTLYFPPLSQCWSR